MRAVQFDRFGGPEVLDIVDVDEPHAGPGEIRVAVRTCGVNALDWKLREGRMGGELPQRMGLEIAGVVDEVGSGFPGGVSVDDRVFGPAQGGAAQFVVVADVATMPDALDFVVAAALPAAVEAATRILELLDVRAGQTLLINGGAGSVGVVTIQYAVALGARVLVTASEPNHDRLRALGAQPTTYGEGLEKRVLDLVPDGVDCAVDLGPGGALPTLIALTGNPGRVLTLTDFAEAGDLGVRTSTVSTDPVASVLRRAADRVARGELTVPIQQTFPLENVADAERLSQSGHVSGKLVLLVS